MIDLFGPPPTAPDPFPVHELAILRAWECADTDEPEYDYALVHPPECGRGEWPADDCMLVLELSEGGLPSVLCGYSWRGDQAYPWLTTYYLRGWVSKFDVPGEPIEYDAGVHVSLQRDEV